MGLSAYLPRPRVTERVQIAELKVNTQTKFCRAGNAATLASLQSNDRLNVQVRACKRAQAMSMELMARRVVAHAPEPS